MSINNLFINTFYNNKEKLIFKYNLMIILKNNYLN